MHLHQPINAILNDERKVRILRFLCRKGGQWSGRRLAAELSLNPVMTHRALRELYQATILEFQKVGNSFVYSVREDHYVVRELLKPLFEREAEVLERLRGLIRQALHRESPSEVLTVALYGSVARGQERPTSDIDVLVLVRSARGKHCVREVIEHLWGTVTKEFGNSLAPYILTVHEARQKYQQGLPVLRNILSHHQVIWGKPLRDMLNGRAA